MRPNTHASRRSHRLCWPLVGLLALVWGVWVAPSMGEANACVDFAPDAGAVLCNGEEDNNLNTSNCSSTTNPCLDSGDPGQFSIVGPGLNSSNFAIRLTQPCGASPCDGDGNGVGGQYFGNNPSITRTAGQKVYYEWTIKYASTWRWGFGASMASPNAESKTVRMRGSGQGVLFDVWGTSAGPSTTSTQVRMASMVSGQLANYAAGQSGFNMTVNTEYHYIVELTNGTTVSSPSGGLRAWVSTAGGAFVLVWNHPTGFGTCESTTCAWSDMLLGGPQAYIVANNLGIIFYDNLRITSTNIAPTATFDFDLGTTDPLNNQTVVVGSSTTANSFNVTSNGQGTPNVTNLSAAVTSGSATGITFTFTPGGGSTASCTPTCSPNPTVTTNTDLATTALGVRTITVTANDPTDSLIHTATFQLTVQSSAPPNPPTLTSVTTPSGVDGDTKVSVAWTPPGSGPTPDTYNLYRCLFHNGIAPPAACTTVLVATGLTTSPYVDSFRVPGSVYTYQLTSVAAAVESAAQSNSLNGTTTMIGIAPAFPADVNIQSHATVTYVERFNDATLAALLARYDSVGEGGSASFYALDAADKPSGSPDKSLVLTSNSPSDAPSLYKNLTAIGANIATQIFVRYYTKPRTGDTWHHSSVTFGGYVPAISFPFPRAGCLPPTATVAGNYNLTNFSFEARDSRPNYAWDTYLYWLGMVADGPGCLGFGCYVDTNTCYFGNELGNPSVYLPALNQWIAIEVMVTLNDPATASNGNIAVWVNGVKTVQYEGYRWRGDLTLDHNYLWIQHAAINTGPTTILKYANLVVARSYVGLLTTGDVLAPAAPTTLRRVQP